jgi:hypothetical protein
VKIGNTEFSLLGVCATVLLTSVLVELPLLVDSANAGASNGGSVVSEMVEEFVELPLSLDTLDVASLFAG